MWDARCLATFKISTRMYIKKNMNGSSAGLQCLDAQAQAAAQDLLLQRGDAWSPQDCARTVSHTVVGDLCTGHWAVHDTAGQSESELFGYNATGLHGFESRANIAPAPEPVPGAEVDSADGVPLHVWHKRVGGTMTLFTK